MQLMNFTVAALMTWIDALMLKLKDLKAPDFLMVIKIQDLFSTFKNVIQRTACSLECSN